MVRKGSFQVRLVTKKNEPLREIHDTADDRYYAVSRAGDEYKVRHTVVGVSAGFAVELSGNGTDFFGAIIQVDGSPSVADFPRSPFTYFKSTYIDPGFWTKPSGGQYKSRVFAQPTVLDDPIPGAGGAASEASSATIGKIKVFFFEVCQVERKNQVARKYEEPSEAKAPEGKKWYLNSAATRYSGNKIDPSSSTGTSKTYQIKDRTKPLETIEVWYKDFPALKLLGWDGQSDVTELMPPWIRAKRDQQEQRQQASKKARVVLDTIDLTTEDNDGADDIKPKEVIHIYDPD